MTDNLIQRTASAYTYPLLIKNLLQGPVVNNPKQEIVYRDQLRFTYQQFRERVCRLAGALTELGVKAGDTVAVMDYDSHRYLECFFAVPMLGAVLHTVNVRLSPEQILYTIDHAEDDFLLVHEDFLPIVEQIKGRIDTVQHYILLSEQDEQPATGLPMAGEYEALLSAAAPDFDFQDFDESTRATTFYTTGTTGMPKGVYFSHRQLVLHTLGVLAALGTSTSQGRFHQDDVYMPITPMFHVHAWGLPYVATALGVKQVYPGKYTPDMLLGLLEKEKVTFSHCVPTILHLLMNHPSYEQVDLSNWKVIIGGAALPKAMCEAALEKGIDIFTGYGMSETCPILTFAQLTSEMLKEDDQAEIRCKTGRPIPLVQLRLVDEEMNDIPKDGESVGEIVVRAPWLTQGYLKDQRNSEVLWRGGYLHTGDVANMDRENYAKITDRIKDVIKIGGEWVSSLELEDILCSHPAVGEVAVIGLPDTKWGEKPLALVVHKENAEQITAKQLLAHTKEFIEKGMLTKQALLLKIVFVDSIDKTSVGKINKKALREKYAAS
ncbi:MAG: long-chain fatty acid--CoA ligase [Desulfuromonas sp.]|nr:MAG: long-chain fatty acid--CoA ligase [Desulfuromonas sp.]